MNALPRSFQLPCSPFAPSRLYVSLLVRVLSILLLATVSSALAMDRVTLRRDGKTLEAIGKVLVTAQDGGLVLLARDGVLWLIPPNEQVDRTTDAASFAPLTRDELKKHILAELPKGFRVLSTSHYLIFHDTSPAYAQWCGSLFEQLYSAFINVWTHRKFELTEPEFPLVAIVFADRQAYLKFSQPELGDAAEGIIGYFSLTSNRMTMYDLTGVQPQGRRHGSTSAQINQILAQPEVLRTISTIVHEATHQIAFNCGLHTRLSDCPRWFSEGIAMYFETPDLGNGIKKGWSGIGDVNQPRLDQFLKCLADRPVNSLETLIRDDRRFTDSKRASDAYAEAWALTYFLIRQHPKEFISYLRMLSAKKPLMPDAAEQRLDEFRRAFGDLADLNVEFLRFITRQR